MTTAIIPETVKRPDVDLGHGISLPYGEVVRRCQFLSEPERQVLVVRHGLAGPARDIAQTALILGLTPARVRALDGLACAKLRHPSTGGVHVDRGVR